MDFFFFVLYIFVLLFLLYKLYLKKKKKKTYCHIVMIINSKLEIGHDILKNLPS